MNIEELEFGLNTFGEVSAETPGGQLLTEAETVRLIIDEAVLAESVGLDVFSIGEHYRDGHVDTAGHMILATIAGRTKSIRLGTSVTVLSTQDPVRLFNNFSTLDAASNGRAQLILGRASSTDSFPLFGYDLADYEHLFEEKLELFTRLLHEQPVTWDGSVRPALTEQHMSPALATPASIPTWIGVGGSPQSVIRAAKYGLPLMLAIIGGQPTRFAPYVDLYYRALEQFGHPRLPVGQHSLGLIADTDKEAVEAYWPEWNRAMLGASRDRGFPTPTRRQYDSEIEHGALFVGSPETVAAKVADDMTDLDLTRFDFKYDIGNLSRGLRARSIELFGTEVAPRVRELLAERAGAAIDEGEPVASGRGA
jgi:probable LLM family oxidoreductase